MKGQTYPGIWKKPEMLLCSLSKGILLDGGTKHFHHLLHCFIKDIFWTPSNCLLATLSRNMCAKTHMAWRDMNLWTRTWFKYGKPEMLLCSLSLGRRHQTFPSLTSLLHKRHLEYLQIVCWKHCLWIGVQTTYMVWRDMNMCTRTWFEIHKYVSVNIDHHMCVSKEGKY